MLMGEALDEMKDPVGADARIPRRGERRIPKSRTCISGLATCCGPRVNTRKRLPSFRRSSPTIRSTLQAMLYLADAKMQMNQPDEARPLLEKVSRSSVRQMRWRIATSASSMPTRTASRKLLAEFQAAIKIDPTDVNAHYRLARVYRSMGKSAEAKTEFDKASSLNKAEDERLLKVMSTIPKGESKAPPGPEK